MKIETASDFLVSGQKNVTKFSRVFLEIVQCNKDYLDTDYYIDGQTLNKQNEGIDIDE
ncbi:MAG: hypothetical protein VB095_09545 [Anaerovorax sp.]|nr:hypothetical protein [Anaerovorax sp.]